MKTRDVRVIPREGRRVRDPETGLVLPEDGRVVRYSPHWERQRRVGDVEIQVLETTQADTAQAQPGPIEEEE